MTIIRKVGEVQSNQAAAAATNKQRMKGLTGAGVYLLGGRLWGIQAWLVDIEPLHLRFSQPDVTRAPFFRHTLLI